VEKRYVVFKILLDGRKPIVCFDAINIDEANDNLAWLRKKHADEPDYLLGVGEFFEILERSQMSESEWEAAEQSLCRQKGGNG